MTILKIHQNMGARSIVTLKSGHRRGKNMKNSVLNQSNKMKNISTIITNILMDTENLLQFEIYFNFNTVKT